MIVSLSDAVIVALPCHHTCKAIWGSGIDALLTRTIGDGVLKRGARPDKRMMGGSFDELRKSRRYGSGSSHVLPASDPVLAKLITAAHSIELKSSKL